MSVYIMVGGKPLPGRFNEVETRMRTIAGVMAQKGSNATRLHQTLLGDGSGRLSLVAEFESFHEAMSTFEEVRKDPLFLEVSKKILENPAVADGGANVFRDFYGTVDNLKSVHLRRTYQISRENLPQMTEIIKEVDALSPEYKVAAVIPVMAPNMDYLHGVYHFDSLTDAGKIMDEVGMTPKFQELVSRGNEVATLIQSSINIKM